MHHVRVQAVTQGYTGHRCTRATGLSQHQRLESGAVLAPQSALSIDQSFHRPHDLLRGDDRRLPSSTQDGFTGRIPAVEGVEQYNARADESARLSLLAVDTHGYTYVAMTVAKMLGFDLCPQLRDLAERRLYLPRSADLPENLERIALTNVSEPAITKGWDELLRLIASIRGGRVSPKAALERLGSAARCDPMHKAADQLGRLLRTLFPCDYFSNDEFRRELHTLLNRGESVHQLLASPAASQVSGQTVSVNGGLSFGGW